MRVQNRQARGTNSRQLVGRGRKCICFGGSLDGFAVRCNELLNILTFLMELPRRLCHSPKQGRGAHRRSCEVGLLMDRSTTSSQT